MGEKIQSNAPKLREIQTGYRHRRPMLKVTSRLNTNKKIQMTEMKIRRIVLENEKRLT